MSNIKKLMMTAAGAGDALNVEDVFSTYLYKGNSGTQRITNGIALADGVGGGTSTEFDGSSDYLERSFSESTRTQMTFSAWIYPEYNTSGKTYFRNGATTAPYEFNIQVGSDSNLDFYLITGNQSKSAIGTNKTLGFNNWHHILFSINTSTGVAQLYIDDVSVGVSNTSSGEDLKPLLNSFQIMKGEGSGKAEGKVAHVFLDYTYRDLSTTSNRRLFIDADGGSTSPSTLSALSPILYLPMTDAYSVGENIGTGGDFTAYGSPTVVDSGTEYLSGVGQGGLVWIKRRETSGSHILQDDERGNKWLRTDLTDAELDFGSYAHTFNTDGFTLNVGNANTNASSGDYASWTFRKAPKFFDVVTYTGNGNDTRVISHSLTSTPAFAVVKRTSATGSWIAWHTGISDGTFLTLNATSAATSHGSYPIFAGASSFSDTTVTLGGGSGNLNKTLYNNSGDTYVLYLFAHNNSDGDFGPTGDQDIIKCGSYTGDDLDDGPEINLGFEPQWLLVKNASTARNWIIVDNMRGIPTGGNDANLYPNLSNAEDPAQQIRLTPTGFKCEAGGNNFNGNGHTMIYIAIRRGPMAVPTSGTDVFVTRYRGEDTVLQPPMFYSGWPVDMAFQNNDLTSSTSDHRFSTRLTGHHFLVSSSTAAESTGASSYTWDYMDGWVNATGTASNYRSWMWRRAPNFFDVVAYTGNATAGNTISHNLGVAPEMMWVKRRDLTGSWAVYHTGTDATAPEDKYLKLESTAAAADLVGAWNDTAPTATEFTLGNWSQVNNTNTYVAYLFASLDGVSKVGSYTGNGNTEQNIDCGFSAGARFVLIKKTSHTGSWFLFDSARGIISGNSPYLELNTTAAESSSYNELSPYSSGFTVRNGGGLNLNFNGHTFVFYAIA